MVPYWAMPVSRRALSENMVFLPSEKQLVVLGLGAALFQRLTHSKKEKGIDFPGVLGTGGEFGLNFIPKALKHLGVPGIRSAGGKLSGDGVLHHSRRKAAPPAEGEYIFSPFTLLLSEKKMPGFSGRSRSRGKPAGA